MVPPLFPEPSLPEEASELLPVEAVAEFPMEPVAETIAHPPEVHEEATTPGPASIPVDHEVAELPVEETGAEVQEAPASLSQDETPTLETGLPKTETMGDLLFDQGHSEEALSVYEGALEKDPASQTLPEKIRTVKMVLRMIPSDEPEKAPILASEPVTPEEASPEPEPEVLTAEKPAGPPEPEAEPVAAAPAPLAAPSRKECRKESSAHTLPERIIEMVSSRMGRDLLGYLLSTCDGLPVEATDSGHWADVLAADGVEIIRTVADMTRQLGWGEFHGTIVWLDRAILYGVPIEGDRALFLVLKPESNIGLCRLLVSRATKGPETDGA
jgi:predicted regulator of Ras-like GTPase activity (Roadblock/LC7/MglB family)